MLGISTDKVAYIILRAREWDVKTEAWDDSDRSGFSDYDAESVLEDIPRTRPAPSCPNSSPG